MRNPAFAMVVSLLCPIGILGAQGCLEPAGSLGYGVSYAIAADQNYLYTGNGTVLQIYCIAEPAAPALVSELDLGGMIFKIVLAPFPGGGTGAFVAAYRAGMIIVDITDPLHPAVVSRFPVSMCAFTVAVSGSLAFVGDGEDFGSVEDRSVVRVVDLADPSHPVELSQIHASNPFGVVVRGDYLYAPDGVWGGRILRIIDIADPSNPRVVADALTGSLFMKTVALYDHAGRTYAYLCGGVGDVWVADVTDPRTPVPLGAVEMDAIEIVFKGTVAYAAGLFDGMDVFDMTDPKAPRWLGSALSGNSTVRTRQVAVSAGEYAYLANWSIVSVVDIQDPEWPTEISSMAMGASSGYLELDGSAAYVSSGLNGIRILDFSDPLSPRVLGRYDTSGQAFGMAKKGDLLYIADNWRLTILDVSVPSAPWEVGYYHFGDYYKAGIAFDVVEKDGYLFVASSVFGLHVLDVSDPAQPFKIGELNIGADAHKIARYGELIYLAGYASGLMVIDISVPAVPQLVWAESLEGAGDVHISMGRAYIVDYWGVNIFDLARPDRPRWLARIPVPGWPVAVAVAGSRVFTASWQDPEGLSVFDISDLRHIERIDYQPTRGMSGDMNLQESMLYISDGIAGVAAYNASGCIQHGRPLGPPD